MIMDLENMTYEELISIRNKLKSALSGLGYLSTNEDSLCRDLRVSLEEVYTEIEKRATSEIEKRDSSK